MISIRGNTPYYREPVLDVRRFWENEARFRRAKRVG